MNVRKRRVFLDLGANELNTGVQWFMRMYPCDFTEVHAFGAIPDLFRIPQQGADESLHTEVSVWHAGAGGGLQPALQNKANLSLFILLTFLSEILFFQ